LRHARNGLQHENGFALFPPYEFCAPASARRLRDLKAAPEGVEIEAIEPVERPPRALRAALFRNKPEAVEAPLRELALDRGVDWYMRIQAVESIIAFAQRRSADALEAALAWAAGIAADESEDWTLRLVAGNKLLDFPRERHRALLEDLAARQTGWGVHFSQDDVRQAFTAMNEKPHRDRFDDPWAFYAPAAIERRQARWAEEDHGDEESDEDDFAVEEPYVRPGPKIGRNDPCPCGSGKKYKKCCLLKEES
jgi:hypothetical protein